MTKKKTEEKIETQPEQTAELSQLERKHYAEINRLNDICSDAAIGMVNAKEIAKAATEEYNGAVSLLRSTIRRGANKQPELPGFEAGDESWHEVELCLAIKMTNKQAEMLLGLNIITVGSFEDLRAGKHKDYPRGLSDLPGVGQATIDKWEDQMSEWWAARNQDARPAASVTYGKAAAAKESEK